MYSMGEGEALGFALDREKSFMTNINDLLKNSAGVRTERAPFVEPLVSIHPDKI